MNDYTKAINDKLARAEELNKLDNPNETELAEFNACMQAVEDLNAKKSRDELLFKVQEKHKQESRKSDGRQSPVFFTEQEIEESKGMDCHPDVMKFSISKCIFDIENYGKLMGLEAEINQELKVKGFQEAKHGVSGLAFRVPSVSKYTEFKTKERLKFSNADTSTNAGLIWNPTLYGDFITFLRNKTYVERMGATVYQDLVGNTSIPRQSGTVSLSWTDGSLTTAPSGTNPTADSVPLVMKTAIASVNYPRNLLRQANFDVESYLRQDLSLAFAVGIDGVVLNGSGSGNIPLGIANNTSAQEHYRCSWAVRS